MRITEHERNTIIEAVKSTDPDARVWLFGSRVDDNKKGGDIAVLSESIRKDVMKEIQVRRYICDRIGEQKIDIVTSKDGKEAIFQLAMFYFMDKGSIKLLKENLDSVNLSLKRLLYSWEICNKIGLKENYSEEDFVEYEAMTSRYTRTTDMLINKVLRSLDASLSIQELLLMLQIIRKNAALQMLKICVI
ncbi:MAG: hypothetical protein LBU88_08370 [Treponema sp.]|jgi:predicted nucleotidyltransferase|nr:hypothetical protein [Treponema sp.]